MASDKPRPKARTRLLSQSERLLWHHAVKDAKPLETQLYDARLRDGHLTPIPLLVDPPAMPAPPASAAASIKATKQIPISIARAGLKSPSYDGLDRRTAERFGRGQLAIDGRLDLHGMTQEQAHNALDVFIARAWDRGKRVLLIITGKGNRSGREKPPWTSQAHETGGVLRAAAPRWLHEHPNRARVLAVTEAQPRHGGGGALYVLIRRHRD